MPIKTQSDLPAKEILENAVPVSLRIFDSAPASIKLLQKHQNTILDIVGFA